MPSRMMYARRTARPRTGSPHSMCRCRSGCARPASAPACSPSRSRWTNSPSPAASIPSNCASATSPTSIRRPATRGRTVGSSNASGPAPSGSAGRREIPRRGAAATASGWSAPASPSAVYPAMPMPGNTARIEHVAPGRYAVQIGAVDIGTGTWTALTQIAADALGCDVEAIDLQIGDTDLPRASVEGGSSGISSWGAAISLRHKHSGRSTATSPHVGARPRPPRRRRTRTPRSTACTRSARNSSRSASTGSPARSTCPGCSACSRSAGRSTRPRCAHN